MPLKRLAETGFACPHYQAIPGGRRCQHYLAGGACSRPDQFMCVEWLRANAQAAARPSLNACAGPGETNELGSGPDWLPLPPDALAAFQAGKTEVCIATREGEQVWLVPTPTGQDCLEVSATALEKLALVRAVFPDSEVISLWRHIPRSKTIPKSDPPALCTDESAHRASR